MVSMVTMLHSNRGSLLKVALARAVVEQLTFWLAQEEVEGHVQYSGAGGKMDWQKKPSVKLCPLPTFNAF